MSFTSTSVDASFVLVAAGPSLRLALPPAMPLVRTVEVSVVSMSDFPGWSVIRWIYRQLTAALFLPVDLILGTRTTRLEPLSNIFGSDPSFYASRPSSWSTLLRTFRRLDVQPHDVLIDVGCGSGRVVVGASLFQFRRVLGVELDPALCQQAQRNVAGLRFGSSGKAEIIRGDAVAYGVPDDVTVVFMSNPFQGQVFQNFTDQLLRSLDRAPRRLRLVYFNPVEHGRLVATGRFRLVGSFGGWRPDSSWRRSLTTHVYEVERSSSERVGRTPGSAMATADGGTCSST